MEKNHKFHTLDALRGIAALVVMQFHAYALFGTKWFLHGYLAVDFFFLLSGFVLTFAYQKRLDEGWSTGSFLLARWIRLYPLYFFGLALGLVLKLIQVRFGSVHPSMAVILGYAALGLFVLPAPWQLQTYAPSAFPLNLPTWSLFLEMVANGMHALLFRRRGEYALLSVLTLCAVGTVYGALRLGKMDFGSTRAEILYGVPRVLFSYVCGILLFRAWSGTKRRIRVHPGLPGVALLVLLWAPVPERWAVAYGLVATMALFPILLLVSAGSDTSERLVPVAEWLGTLSYALYVLHYPMLDIFGRLWVHLRGHGDALDAPWTGMIYTGVVIAVSLLVARWYDVPVRRMLGARRTSASRAVSVL